MSNNDELNTSLCINHQEDNNDHTIINDNLDSKINKQVFLDNDPDLYINSKETENNPDLIDNLNLKNDR